MYFGEERLLYVYKSIVGPNFEYAYEVWVPS